MSASFSQCCLQATRWIPCLRAKSGRSLVAAIKTFSSSPARATHASTIDNSGTQSATLKATSYPFSDCVKISGAVVEKDSKVGLMQTVHQKLISTSANTEFHSLFQKNHPNALRPLSVLQVETYINSSRTTTNIFTGVLMAVRRRGIETSFRLRCMIDRVGIEVKYSVFSPMIKNIVVVKRAGEISGPQGRMAIRKPRRAKLFYLRDHPDKLPDIRKMVNSAASEKNSNRARSKKENE